MILKEEIVFSRVFVVCLMSCFPSVGVCMVVQTDPEYLYRHQLGMIAFEMVKVDYQFLPWEALWCDLVEYIIDCIRNCVWTLPWMVEFPVLVFGYSRAMEPDHVTNFERGTFCL